MDKTQIQKNKIFKIIDQNYKIKIKFKFITIIKMMKLPKFKMVNYQSKIIIKKIIKYPLKIKLMKI